MLSASKKIRVLVVDDSILARTMISNGLKTSPQIEIVGTAFNAQDARAKVEQLKPNVMTLDVEMPGMSGIEFLKQLLPVVPLPVILVSSLNLRVFDALSAGAVDFIRKPEPGQNETFVRTLTSKVITAASAKVRVQSTPLITPAKPALSSAGGVRLPATGAGQCDYRPWRLYRRHRGHPGGHEAAACRHSAHAHRPAYARRLHPDVRRPSRPPVPYGGA